jgi:hypothetical protein
MHGYWKETTVFEKNIYSAGKLSSLNIPSIVELSVIEKPIYSAGNTNALHAKYRPQLPVAVASGSVCARPKLISVDGGKLYKLRNSSSCSRSVLNFPLFSS